MSYVTRTFITVFTRAHYWSLSRTRYIHSVLQEDTNWSYCEPDFALVARNDPCDRIYGSV